MNPKHAAAFDACIQAAAHGGQGMMERMAEAARERLFARAGALRDLHQRRDMEEAGRLVMVHRDALARLYPQTLLTALSSALAPQPTARPVAALKFSELELMGESQVQENVEIARAQQAVDMAVDQQLGELGALVCAAQGLPTLRPERNPLRPETYVRALHQVVQRFDVPPDIRLKWMQALGEALGRELKAAYAALARQLRDAGVGAAGYSVHAAPQPGGAARGSAPGLAAAAGPHGAVAPRGHAGQAGPPGQTGPAGGGGGGSAAPTRDGLLTVEQLRRLIAGDYDQPRPDDAQPMSAQEAASYFQTVPAALEALQAMRQVGTVMERLALRQGQSAGWAGDGRAVYREQLRQQAPNVGAALGIEVVELMIDSLADDERLLPAIREVVRALDKPLLQLAMVDPRFFSDPTHPARALLDQITQRSLAYKTEQDEGFDSFLAPLRMACDALFEAEIASAEPFRQTLAVLQEAWDERARAERERREKAVAALLVAEQRQLLAEKIGGELRARKEAALVPPEVMQFLCGPWSQLMARARLEDKSGLTDPQGHLATAIDLMWSAQPELAREQPTRLLRLVPGLLARLKGGLATIEYPAERSAAFFDALMLLHQQGLKPPPRKRGPAPAPALSRAQLEARFDAAAEEAWLAPQEAQDSGFLDSEAALASQPAFESTLPNPDDDAQAVPGIAGLRVGGWVELQTGTQWVRARLTWASPHGKLFMFTGANGTPYSMTVRVLEAALARGGIRVLAGGAVVEGALDAVAAAALRNSVDLSL